MGLFCEICNQAFRRAMDKAQHDLAKGHKQCLECNKWFESYEILQEHAMSESFDVPSCGIRGEMSTSDNSIKDHNAMHDHKVLTCWGCERRFKSVAHMFDHIETGECPGDMSRQVILTAVRRCKGIWRNKGKKASRCPLICVTCGEEFLLPSGLLQHMETADCPEGFVGGYGTGTDMIHKLRRALGIPDSSSTDDKHGFEEVSGRADRPSRQEQKLIDFEDDDDVDNDDEYKYGVGEKEEDLKAHT